MKYQTYRMPSSRIVGTRSGRRNKYGASVTSKARLVHAGTSHDTEKVEPKYREPNTPGTFGKPRHKGTVAERRAPRRAINASKRIRKSLLNTNREVITLS